jgi:general secretion pathway protein G
MERNRRTGRRPRQRGITLLEIMVVLAIIGLVMGVLVGPRVWNAWRNTQPKAAYFMEREIITAYHGWLDAQQDAKCPDRIEDLAKYVNTSKTDMKDPWGHLYIMKCGDQVPPDSDDPDFAVVSAGQDGRENTEDDVRSWDSKRFNK